MDSFNRCLVQLQNCVTSLQDLSTDISDILPELYVVLEYCQDLPFESSIEVVRLLERAITVLEQSQTRCEVQIGRPRIHIPRQSLEYLLSINFKVSDIAKIYHVSRRTISDRLMEFNLSVRTSISVLDHAKLYKKQY